MNGEPRVDFNPSDTIGLLGELTSQQLNEISIASKSLQENVSLLRPGTGMEEYLRSMLQYALEKNVNPSGTAAREIFVDNVVELRENFPRLRGVLYEGVDDRSALIWKMRRNLSQMLKPWIGEGSTTLSEWASLHDFVEKSASEHERRPISGWHSSHGGKFELTDTLGLDRLGDETQQNIDEMLSQLFREEVSDKERSKLNPEFFDQDQASEFATQWWEQQDVKKISESDIFNEVVSLLTTEVTKKEGWTLQSIYNITEIIGCRGPKKEHLSKRMVSYLFRHLAESVAIPLSEHTAGASQPGRTDILEIIVSRLKDDSDTATNGYARWLTKANGIK